MFLIDFFSVASELKEPFVVATLVSTKGHAPQDPGAKAIVTRDGLHWGTIGGGKVEARAVETAQQLIESGISRVKRAKWNLQRDVGMSCGGEVEILFEIFRRRNWSIYIFGAGHISQALCRLLVELDCRVTCLDTRPEWLERLPQGRGNLSTFLFEDYETYKLSQLIEKYPSDSFFVVTTKGHSTDLPVVESIAQSALKPAYVGVIGSKVKGIKVRSDLVQLGLSSEFIESIYCPMGIPIQNTNDPAEIAISIAAQLIQIRGKGDRDLRTDAKSFL